MNQEERRIYLIRSLLNERKEYRNLQVPSGEADQRRLLRSLFNIRPPSPIGGEFLKVQDEYLEEETRRKGVTELDNLKPVQPGIYLWRGDITTLACDAIVNAANSGMTGCYQPCHSCIDNCIHTYAGIQLRNFCADLMEQQGYEEPAGRAKITPAFNLPSGFVIHTVGPIVSGRLTQDHCDLLASCYRSCLDAAEQNGLHSIAFCCISTGVFMFPREKAAEIAVQTVKDYLSRHSGIEKVVFNVYTDADRIIYESVLDQ